MAGGQPLPPGWASATAPSGATYFYNKSLNVSQYTFPEAPQQAPQQAPPAQPAAMPPQQQLQQPHRGSMSQPQPQPQYGSMASVPWGAKQGGAFPR